MANKALGRDLGDLLSRARPARLVTDAAARPPLPSTPSDPPPPPIPQDLPLDPVALGATPTPSPSPLTQPTVPRPIHKPSTYRRPASAYPPPPSAATGPWEASSDPAGAFYILLVLDSIFLGAGAIFAFTHWVPTPLSRYLAVAAVVAGGICSALAYILRPVPPPKPEASKVRVHLRRI